MESQGSLPYLPEGRTILYVPENNEFMIQAKEAAEKFSLDPGHRTGAVIVQLGEIIGRGANGSRFHDAIGCVRKFFKAKTGTLYWLCPGCSPYYHAEQKAIRNVNIHHKKTQGADLYLWGHWWCCQSCWKVMIDAGIQNVYLLQGAKEKWGK